MSCISENGYTGTICFAKNLEHGLITTFDYSVEEFERVFGDSYVLLGTCEVDVKFTTDTREVEIVALEKKREEVRGQMAAAIAKIDGRIENLRALPNMTGKESEA